jgi:AcrR family transcriptional regulator
MRAQDWGDKRQAILDAGALLFAKVGYANARMEEIARACGATKSMLYHYFPRKEDLLFEIVREHAAGALSTMEEVLARPLPPAQRLAEFVGGWVRQSLAARARNAVLMYDLKFLPRRQQAVILDLERRMIERLGALVAELCPALPRAGTTAPKTYALLLFGMLNWTETWFRAGGAFGPEEMASRISRLFLAGLAAER